MILLPAELRELLRRPSPCFVATVMPDGSPQLTQTWVTTDGENVVINVVRGSVTDHNMARDPRVAVNIADPDDVSHYYAVRGRVVAMTTEGAAENIEELSRKYLGRPYPGFRGVPESRVLVTIAVEAISHDPTAFSG